MRAVRFHANGGPEVLKWEEVDDPVAGSDEVLIRLEAVGLNYIDTYHREGLYRPPSQHSGGGGCRGSCGARRGSRRRCRR